MAARPLRGDRGAIAVSDLQQFRVRNEVYDRLYYGGARLGDPVPSILRRATRDDAVISVQSFSKTELR